MSERVKRFLFSYWYRGHEYSIEIPASTQREAVERVLVISSGARYTGELASDYDTFSVEHPHMMLWAGIKLAFSEWWHARKRRISDHA